MKKVLLLICSAVMTFGPASPGHAPGAEPREKADLRAGRASPVPWPADFDDDTVLPMPGGLPPEMRFSPGKWAVIKSFDPRLSLKSVEASKDLTGIRNISCEQAREIIRDHRKDPSFVILDFRAMAMFDQAHIEGAVVHDVFSSDIDAWLQSLPRNKVYLLYCTAGHRSEIALEKMKTMGFANILHMNEGITRWKQLGYETEKKS